MLRSSRATRGFRSAERRAASHALMLATGIQGVHFAEEAVTGFHQAFPGLFGLPPMSFPLFVAFNVIWLVIWACSVIGIRSDRSVAVFAAWFLAIAAAVNGIAHPAFAITVGGYFPGLLTSPVIGLAGIWLWWRLHQASGEPSDR